MDHVGKKLKQLRKEHKYTLREVGKAINVDFAHISRLESGKKVPTLELLEAFANFYNVPMSYFFGEEQPLPKELEDAGVEWMVYGDKWEKDRKLTPEDIENILEVLDKLDILDKIDSLNKSPKE